MRCTFKTAFYVNGSKERNGIVPIMERTTAVFSMVLDLFFPKHCVHKDTARYVLSYSKPFELLTKNCLIIGNSSPKSLYLDNNQNDTREYKNK